MGSALIQEWCCLQKKKKKRQVLQNMLLVGGCLTFSLRNSSQEIEDDFSPSQVLRSCDLRMLTSGGGGIRMECCQILVPWVGGWWIYPLEKVLQKGACLSCLITTHSRIFSSAPGEKPNKLVTFAHPCLWPGRATVPGRNAVPKRVSLSPVNQCWESLWNVCAAGHC